MGLLKPLLQPLLAMVPPAFDLDLTAEFVDPRVTFTRASTRTYFDSAGIMRTATVNEWPREYDPATVTRVNLLIRSQDFGQSSWLKTNATVTKNAAIAPDGTVTASKIGEAADANQNHRVQQAAPAFAIAVGQFFAASVYLKAAERAFAFVSVATLGEEYSVAVDLTLGTVSAVFSASAPVLPFSSITPVGHGWFRVSIGFANEDAGTGPTLRVGPLNVSSLNAILPTYDGDGSSGVYAWGAQIEAGSAASDYIPTGATPAGNGVCIGRQVWGQRTNLLVRSQELDNAAHPKINSTISANVAIAPDGSLTADLLLDNTTNGGHSVQPPPQATSAGVTYVYSIYAKAASASRIMVYGLNGTGSRGVGVDLSDGSTFTVNGITLETAAVVNYCGSGWYRISIPITPITTATQAVGATYLVSGNGYSYAGAGTGVYLWGVQLEAGLFASPYIPTTTAAATRSADAASVTGQNFASWYNPSEGTFVAHYSADNDSSANRAPFAVSDGTVNNLININQANLISFVVATGNVIQGIAGNYAISDFNSIKTALAYKANSLQGGYFGSATAEDMAATIPTVDRLFVGASATGNAGYLNGPIRRIRYFPHRLNQNELQALTA